MIAYYLVGNNIDCFRTAFGPLPPIICRIGVFTKNWAFYNICFFTLLIQLTKFTYICVFKSLPIINDNFVATYLNLMINMITLLILYAWMSLPGKEPLSVVSLNYLL